MHPPLAFLLVVLLAAPALAQDAEKPDALGQVLQSQGGAPPIATLPPPNMPGTGPTPALPPGAIGVDQTGRTPDGPMSDDGLAFEQRIRQSVAAAEGLQGALDGEWTLYGADGKVLYVFMFVDPASGRGPLEAAWRDPRRQRGADDLGVVDSLQRDGAILTLNFVAHPGAPPVVVHLQDAGPGWSGQLTDGGSAQTVSLRRN
jgi:hypothetical protein